MRAKVLGRPIEELKLITAHIGNGYPSLQLSW
jgi:acetate kinase